MFIQSILVYLHCVAVILITGFLYLYGTVKNVSWEILEDQIGEKYDYVIVGGGSAGAIVAARLSENPNISVLLIEAGVEKSDFFSIPLLGTFFQLSPFDWQYETVRQEHACFGLKNNISKWPAGKVLGGTTHLNSMIHVRGHYNDFVTWKDSASDNWNYNDILFYFDKAEMFLDLTSHHSKGSIPFRETLFTTPLSKVTLKAAAELGYPIVNINKNLTSGFIKPHLNLNKNNQRWTSDQYLKLSVQNRKNIKIVTNANAEKILLRDGFEAYGVQFVKNGKIKTVFAKEEIVISAGTVGSAKLLMLSGIGPEEILKKAKIETKIDLPVGRNLQDHITTGLDLITLNQTLLSLKKLVHPNALYSYFMHGTGPYTTTMCDALGIIHSDLVNPVTEPPDLELMVMVAGLSSDYGSFNRRAMGITDNLWEEYFSLLTNESVATILPVVLHPKSVGEVRVNEERPHDRPLIDPRYLSDERDVITLIKGIRIVREMVESKAMRELGAKFNTRVLPGCEGFDFDTDEYWRCYVKHVTLTTYHPVGTCKMGDLNNEGVVDHRLRVHKSNRLRIIDASVMPTLTSGNINVPVVMIAEKGADLIKEDYYRRLGSSQIREIFIKSNKCYI